MNDMFDNEIGEIGEELDKFTESSDFTDFLDEMKKYYLDIIFFNEHRLFVETDIYTKSVILYELVKYRHLLNQMEYSKFVNFFSKEV